MKYAEMHCHTFYSNGRSSHPLPLGGGVESTTKPERLLWWARKRGLSAVAITDHNTMHGSKAASLLSEKYGITVIPAQEVDTNERGQILAYGIQEEIKPLRSPAEVIQDVHTQGGIAVIAHPFDIGRGVDRIESFVGADGVEVRNYGAVGNRRATQYARDRGIRVTTGGSDAHHGALVGNVVLEFPDACITAEDYLSALKGGLSRVVVRRNYLVAMAMGGLNILYSRFASATRYTELVTVPEPLWLELERVSSKKE